MDDIRIFDTLEDSLERNQQAKSDRYAVRVFRRIVGWVYGIPFHRVPKISIHEFMEDNDAICPIVLDVCEKSSLAQLLTSRSKQLPITNRLLELRSEYGDDRPIGVVFKSTLGDLVCYRDSDFDLNKVLLADTSRGVDWFVTRLICDMRVYISTLQRTIMRDDQSWRDLIGSWHRTEKFIEKVSGESHM